MNDSLMIKNFKYWNLAFVLIFGIILRLIFLNSHDFWFDENFSLYIAGLPTLQLLAQIGADNTPPLYYLLLKIFMQFSLSEYWLRGLSLISGIASIFLVYLIFEKKGKQITLLSTLFYALSPLMIYFSVETRMYQLLSLETLGFVFLFQKLLEKYTLKHIIILIFLGIIGVYTHYYFILIIIFSLIYILLKRPRQFKVWLLSFILIFISFLPWLIIYIKSSPHPGCWCFGPLTGIIATFISFSLNGVGFVTQREFLNINPIEKFLFVLVSLVVFILFLVGILKVKKDLYYILLLLGSILLLAIISIFKSLFSPRALLIFSPFFYFFAANGLYLLTKKSFIKSSIAIIVLFGIVLLISLTNPKLKGEPLKFQASYIEENFKQGDVIAHTSLYTFYSYKYYLQKDAYNYLIIQPEPSLNSVLLVKNYYQPLSNITPGNKRLWLVFNTEWTSQPFASKLKTQLSRNYPILNEQKFRKTEIILFDLTKKL